MKIQLIAVIASILVFFASSCARKSVPNTSAVVKKDSVITEKPSIVEIRNIDDFQNLSSKGKMDYDDGKQALSPNFNLRIRKDSVIWISASMLGFEGGRCLITKDSIKVMMKLQKEYSLFSFASLKAQTGLEFSYKTLEDLLLGNTLETFTDKNKVSSDSSSTTLLKKLNEIELKTVIDNRTLKITGNNISTHGANASIKYDKFAALGAFLFPFTQDLQINYLTSQGVSAIKVNLQHNKVDLNVPNLSFPFDIPKSYVRR